LPSTNMAPNQQDSPTLSEQEIQDILDAMPPAQLQLQNPRIACSSRTASVKSSDAPNPTGHELKSEARATARSERKRTRERQRRDDVNKQFAGLTRLLRQIEEDDLAENNEITTSCRRLTGQTNRVDLISNAILVLEQKQKAGKSRKNEIVKMKQELTDTNKIVEDTAARLKEATMYQQCASPNQQVMMMMPMMVSPEVARAASSSTYNNGMFQLPPQGNGISQMFLSTMPQVVHQQRPGLSTNQAVCDPQVLQASNPTIDVMNKPQNDDSSCQPMINGISTSDASWTKARTEVKTKQHSTWHHTNSNSGSSSKSDGGNLAHCA